MYISDKTNEEQVTYLNFATALLIYALFFINNYNIMILSTKQDFATLDTLVKIAKEQGFNNLEEAQVYFDNNK